MGKIRMAALSLLLLVAGVSAAAEEFSEVEYYQRLATQKLAESEQTKPDKTPEAPTSRFVEAPPAYIQPISCFEKVPTANTFIALGQYFHSRSDDATIDRGGDKLKLRKSRANGAGVTLLYNRVFSDWLSVAFMYEYAFMNIDGGMAAPLSAVDAYEHTRYDSHVLGISPEFTLGALGKLRLGAAQEFDRAGGDETMVFPGNNAVTMNVDDYGVNVTSLIAWWEKDFDIGCGGWKLTPYAGWRSLYSAVKNKNDFNARTTLGDSHSWTHLASGGLKVSYRKDSWDVALRAGVNHRTTRDDIPGYGNRAVAPGVIHFSHRANMDRTVGAVGAGVKYAINDRVLVGLQYDGYFGKNTSTHTGGMSFTFPF